MTADLGKCDYCGAPILWAVTRKDKRMPLDVDEDPTGNAMLDADRRHVSILGGGDALFMPDGATRHRPHFADCAPYQRALKLRRDRST